MELRHALVDISNDARGWLKTWTRDFSEAEAAQQGAGDGRPNPLAWQLGHLACVEEDVAQLFGSEVDTVVPDELRRHCTTGAPLPPAGTQYPPLSELWALLDRTHARLLGLLEGVTAADLDRPPRVANPYFRSLGQAIYEAALHENYHVGEIGALRKALGKPRIG